MYKRFDSFGDFDSNFVDVSENGINKLASLDSHIPPKLAALINQIEAKPDPKYTYLYDRALGAGEVYGPNNNGDWFGKQELINHHDTFVKHAHLFRHHQNKDPAKAIGDVMASEYNEKLDVVDLIVRAPRERVAHDLEKFAGGALIQTSMGAKVKSDICSICGNEAKTRVAYCSCLRTQMLRILPDGRQVYAKNPNPRFVDISIVIIAADPASTVLRKVASLQEILKNSAMKKKDVGGNVGEGRDVLRPEMIEATNELSRSEAIKTLHEAKGILRPDEFQAVLKKDASLLRPDIIPYVEYRSTERNMLAGRTLTKLANAIQHVAGTPLDKDAQLKQANFLTEDEKYAYLQYRNSVGEFSKVFFR